MYVFGYNNWIKSRQILNKRTWMGLIACTGDRPWDIVKVMLGDWDRGERYIHNIIEDLNHWVVGWTDWNLALDLQVQFRFSNRATRT